MATIRKVVRVSNPRRKRSASGQFKRAGAASTARKRVARNTAARKRNPVPLLIELGAINPRKGKTHRRKNVAKKRVNRRRKATARRNPRRRVARRTVRVHRRRRNPVAVAPVRRRRKASRRVTRRHVARRRRNGSMRRRNPALFGRTGGKDLLYMIGGGLIGVAATKYLPTLLPASISGGLGSGPLMSVALTGAGAFLASFLAGKVDKTLGEAVLFGGLMQTGSAALNAFAPPSIAGRLALSGVGDIVPANYVVPQNPLKAAVVAMPAPSSGMGSLRRYGNFR